MKTRPIAGWHMINWGFVSGTVLAVLLIVFLDSFGSSATPFETLGFLLNPFLWFFGLIFGGIPGAVLGAVESIFVGGRLKDAPEPFTVDDMRYYRMGIYARAGLVPFVIHIGLSLLVTPLDPLLGLGYFFIVGIPVFISMIASVYAAHRYMFRLRLFGMQYVDYLRKPKKKQKGLRDDGLNWLEDLQDAETSSIYNEYEEQISQEKMDQY